MNEQGRGDDHDRRGTNHPVLINAKTLVLIAAFVSLSFVIGFIFTLPSVDGTSKLQRSPSMPSVGKDLDGDRNTSSRNEQAPDEQGSNSGDGDTPSTGDDEVHQMIFSTSCSTFQDWQSYVLFFHAFKVGQPGYVTRIASGCSPEKAAELKRLHKESIEVMSDRFRLHLTPEFSKIKEGFSYKYFNKPFGVRHWLEHALGYPNNTDHDDDIVILLDPDQMLLRPMINDFEKNPVDWKETEDSHMPFPRVRHGFPAAQLYGYRDMWLTKTNVMEVAGNNSPIENVTVQQALDYYPMGPPYMATAHDFYRIAVKWTEFSPKVHEEDRNIYAEMVGYSLAAAHLRLPHRLANSFMVSAVIVRSREGWKMLDSVPENDNCYAAPQESLPYMVHYCHRYLLGKWFFYKYRLPSNFLSCESPMLMEPPSDIGMRYNYSIAPSSSGGKTNGRVYYSNQLHIHRNAFMLCTLIKGLNEASEYFKRHTCAEGAAGTTNFNKSLIFHDSIED